MVDIEKELEMMFKRYSRKPFLFIGAGLSRRYYDLPSWEALLTHLAEHTNDKSKRFIFEGYYQKAIEKLENPNTTDSKFKIYPIIATLIERDYNNRFFNDDTFDIEIKEKYEKEIKEHVSPFKIYICDYIKQKSIENEQLQKERDLFKSLKNRISGIITTNYDTLIESLFENDLFIYSSEQQLFNTANYEIGELYKIHGCIKNPSSIVITADDYEQVINNAPFVSAKLLTFFIENPIIFIGYSINDENVFRLLDTISSRLTSEKKSELKDRLLFIEYTENAEDENIVTIDKHNLLMTNIILNDFNKLYRSMNVIHDGISIKLLRAIQDKIVTLVQSSDPNVDKVYTASIENTDIDESSIAILIGNNNSVFKYGYTSLKMDNINEDIIFNNKNWDPYGVIDNSIFDNKGLFSSTKLPIYKYLKHYNKTLNKWIKDRIITSLDDLFPRSMVASTTYNKINDIVKLNLPFKDEVYLVYKNLKNFDKDDLGNYLVLSWPKRKTLSQDTLFRKLVVAYDFLKYK